LCAQAPCPARIDETIWRFSDSIIERTTEICFSMVAHLNSKHIHVRRNTMKTYLIAALLIAAAVTSVVAETNTFVAPVTPKKQRERPAPPIYKRVVDGVIPRAVRGGNPLQMINPRAPRKYGTSLEAVSLDLTDLRYPGKWRGIKFFEFRF
jgi:hypothetical protein